MFGVLCIIGFPVHLIREVFSIAFVVVVMDTHLPPFEALAYVLPHFDELTHVVIRASFFYSVFVKCSSFKSLLKVYYRSVFAESFKGFGGRCAIK